MSTFNNLFFWDEDLKSREREHGHHAKRNQNTEEVKNSLIQSVIDFYGGTQREWTGKYMHNLTSITESAPQLASAKDFGAQLLQTFHAAVTAQCTELNGELAAAFDTLDAQQAVERVVLLLRNFMFRTKQRSAALASLGVYGHDFLKAHEVAFKTFEQDVLTPQLSDRITKPLLELAATDLAHAFKLSLAYLVVVEEACAQGAEADKNKPWFGVIGKAADGLVTHCEAVVRDYPVSDEQTPREFLETLTLWLLMAVTCSKEVMDLAFEVVIHSKRAKFSKQGVNDLDAVVRIAHFLGDIVPGRTWARFALVSAQEPVLANGTIKILRQFFAETANGLWPRTKWQELVDSLVAEIEQQYASTIMRFDAAWRSFTILQLGVASEHQDELHAMFMKRALSRFGYRFYVDIYRLLLEHGVGTTETVEVEEIGEVGKILLGEDASDIERNRRILQPIPEETILAVSSAVSFARDIRNHDPTDRMSKEFYAELMRCHFPKPLGRGIPPIGATLVAFNILTSHEMANSMQLLGEIERLNRMNHARRIEAPVERIKSMEMPDAKPEDADEKRDKERSNEERSDKERSNNERSNNERSNERSDAARKIQAEPYELNVEPLSSQLCLCSQDRALVREAPAALVDYVAPLAETKERYGKHFSFHRGWSMAACTLNGAKFTCSWEQLEALQKLLKAPGNCLPASELMVGKAGPYRERRVADLVEQSAGFIKAAKGKCEIDWSIEPYGDWAVLEFANLF